MTQQTYPKYDFASAARVKRPLRLKLNRWTQKTVEMFIDQWANFSTSEISVSPLPVDAQSFGEIQKNWEQPCSGIAVSFGSQAVLGFLVVENLQFQVLLMDILGGSDEGTHRELTSIECSLAELIFETVASSYGQGWLDQAALEFELGEFDPLPNRSRLFAADKQVLVSGMGVQLESSNVALQLILAKEETLQLLGVANEPDAPVSVNSGKQVSADKIAEIKVKLQAELGTAQVDMKELVSIAEGDIVVLEQPVDEPIRVTANGQTLFRA